MTHKTFSPRLYLLVVILLTLCFSCSSQPEYPLSDHYDGEEFFNPPPMDSHNGFWGFLKWKLFETPKEWPDRVETEQRPIPQKRTNEGKVTASFVNHSTFLLQVEGINILTDPVWSKRVSPVSWAGPKRVRKPGIAFNDLPPIDYVLISHNHYDHLDLPTIKRLHKTHDPVFLVGLGVEKLFHEEGIKNVKALDWGERHEVEENFFMEFAPAQHWSKRTPFDENETLWGAFIIRSPSSRLYFGGDTGYAHHFKDAGEKFKNFDLALLPIGCYEPRWFMKTTHLNPREAIQAHKDLNAKQTLGIHFETFPLTDEGFLEPRQEISRLLKKDSEVEEKEFIAPEFGKTYQIL